MEAIETFITNIIIYKIISDLIAVTVGAGVCFGATKWPRGLLTTTAIGWGFFLGIFSAFILSNIVGVNITMIIVCILIGVIALPIMTYAVPGVNRFMLGFIVANKLSTMVTTELAKNRTMEISTAIVLPVIIGLIVGVILMVWRNLSVLAFVIGCSFIGSTTIATKIAGWIDWIRIGFDPTSFFDPIDIVFALFKIELADIKTAVIMIIFMAWGGYKQMKRLKEKHIPFDTPLIIYESTIYKNGTIHTSDGRHIETID